MIISWSGGKDSCFILDKLVKQGYEIAGLLTTAPKEYGRSFGHALQLKILRDQAEALALPIYFIESDMKSYTEAFVTKLKELRDSIGIEAVGFGDLYLDGHREWGEKVVAEAGLEAVYPLWMKQEQALSVLKEFTETGYEAIVTRVDPKRFSEEYLGRPVNRKFYEAVQQFPICPMGESGEYHTLVVDGPLFNKRINLLEANIRAMETTLLYDIESYELNKKAVE